MSGKCMPILDAVLNCRDEPNAVAAMIQEALEPSGCRVIVSRGPRQGQRCGGEVVFDARGPVCICLRDGAHFRIAHQRAYADIVSSVIDGISPERWARIRRKEARDEERRRRWEEDAEREAARAARKRAERVAADESRALGLGVGPYTVRPDGVAPEGLVWSYRLGRWVDMERMRARVEATRPTEPVRTECERPEKRVRSEAVAPERPKKRVRFDLVDRERPEKRVRFADSPCGTA